MENKMNKFGLKRLLAVLTVAFTCVCMWGCSDDDYRRWGGRYEGTLVAIIDDSLALLTNSRGYEDCHDVFMGSEECERRGTNDGLFLVNYRKQQSPYWGDTVDGEISLISGYYNDSSAFFSNTKNEFGFWKIGEKPRVVRKWNCETPCRCDWRKYGRPWIDGNVLLKMENQNECPYAVLDTVSGIVKKLDFSGEYAWLEGCDDITYIDGDAVCLRQRGNEYCEINFEKNGIVTNVDVYESNKQLNDSLIEILTQPLAYSSMTSHYCKKLYERRLQELISEAQTEEQLEAVKEFKRKYGTLEYKINLRPQQDVQISGIHVARM